MEVSSKNSPDGNPRAAQVRISAASTHKTGGQRKHDLRIGRQPDYVDTGRTHLNRIIISPKTTAEMSKRSAERRARGPSRRKMRSDAAVSFSGIISFGHLAQGMFEKLTAEQQDAAFHELARAIADELEVSLTGLVIHCDETAIHAHFQTDSYDHHGNALSVKVNRTALQGLQDLTFKVMSAHCPGIERGNGKIARLKAGAKPADVVHKPPAKMRRELAEDIAKTIEKKAGLDEDVLKLQARIDKLKAYGEELTDKGKKQLETAERRLLAKLSDLEMLDKAEAKITKRIEEGAAEAQRATERATEAQKATAEALSELEALRPAVEAVRRYRQQESDRKRAEVSKDAVQAIDFERAKKWLIDGYLSHASLDEKANALGGTEFINRLYAGMRLPEERNEVIQTDLEELLDDLRAENPDVNKLGDKVSPFMVKTLLKNHSAWTITAREVPNSGKMRAKVAVDIDALRHAYGLPPQGSDEKILPDRLHRWKNGEPTLDLFIHRIGEALTRLATWLRIHHPVATPKPQIPPEAKPLLELPEPTQKAVEKALTQQPRSPNFES